MMGRIDIDEIAAVMAQNEDIEGVVIFRDGTKVYLDKPPAAPAAIATMVEFAGYRIGPGHSVHKHYRLWS